MPRASHRLNLLLVPADPERRPDPLLAGQLFAALRAEAVTDAWDRPGPRAEALHAGGFALFRADFPPEPVIYGNRQGGYRAVCPACGASVVAAVLQALKRWRASGDMGLRCERCGVPCSLSTVIYQPDAAPARFALELRDVERPIFSPSAQVMELLERTLGQGFRCIASRGP